MALRPALAKWFELLIARDELAAALQCLADTGQVELQAHSETSAAALLPTLRAAVDEYKRLAQRYGDYWPSPPRALIQRARAPEEIPAVALRQLHSWAVDADSLIDRLQALAHERSELQLLERLLSQPGGELPDLQLFAQAGPVLASRAYVLPTAPRTLGVPPSVLAQTIACGEDSYVLAVGPAEQIAVFDDTLSARKARRFVLPPGLPSGRETARAYTRARLETIAGESQALESRLAELHRTHEVSGALADLSFIEWLVQNVPPLALTEQFAWITGWTSDLVGGRLQAALNREHLHYLLRFPDAPQEIVQPVVLRNPRWVQPFELFSRLLGMPSASEADPSRLLAFVAPLMFGYMFADVGQGAVLVVAGAVLRRRFPATELLISGGVAAIVFGFLFGSVFADDGILPALWLRPLDRPLVLLEVGLAFGAGVILLGLALNAVQYHWSGRGAEWWATGAALVLCYAGMACAPFDRRALWALPLGLGWYLVGSAMLASSDRLSRLGAAAGEALETLVMNHTTRTAATLVAALVVLAVIVGAGATLLLLAPTPAVAQTPFAAAVRSEPQLMGWAFVSAALSTGLAALGAGYAVGRVGSAAVGAVAEKPDLFGRVLVLVGLAEGIAIYGLIVSILILNRIV